MTTFVALLRGVNVGKAKRVPMEDLRRLLAGLGYTRVATLLNSGNAIFDAPRDTPAGHASAIAAAIAGGLEIDVPVVVKSARELTAIVCGNPLARRAEDHSRLLVAFTQEARSLCDLAAIRALVVPPERYVLGRHAAYLLCAGGILQSKAGAALLGKAGQAATTRNWTTTLRLHALATSARN